MFEIVNVWTEKRVRTFTLETPNYCYSQLQTAIEALRAEVSRYRAFDTKGNVFKLNGKSATCNCKCTTAEEFSTCAAFNECIFDLITG